MLLGCLDALGHLIGKRDGLLETDGKLVGIMLGAANTDSYMHC